MAYFQLPPDVLRVGATTPYALRDKVGNLLVPRGSLVATSAQLEHLLARELYVDEQDSELIKRAMAGKLDSMVRKNVTIGRIAEARPDAGAVADALAGEDGRRIENPTEAWSTLQLRMASLLRDPAQPDFQSRLLKEQRNLLALVNGAPDIALLLLVHNTAQEVRDYSAAHALLVAVVCDLAARNIAGFTPELRQSLRCAALTMNISMTQLQNQLALQEAPLTPEQRAHIKNHGPRGAAAMRSAGITDELWLKAVEQHHAMPPGPLSALPIDGQLARLIQRADIFAARLSPRKQRPALSANGAAKAAYLDENEQPDDAGSAIIKAIGIYPPGCLVRLASGEAGIVLKRGQRANEPRVASVTNALGNLVGEHVIRNTQLAQHAVKGGIAPHELKVRLNMTNIVRLA